MRPERSRSIVTAAGLGLLTALTVGPLLLEPRPVRFLEPFSSPFVTAAGIAGVLLLMGLALAVRARLDVPGEPHAAAEVVLFAALAGLMTFLHWLEVDRFAEPSRWQRDLYLDIFNHAAEAPHNYRPLPYGFARLLERVTHDWGFACVGYRWFFTFWFVWASYRLARRYLDPHRALLTLIPLVLLYPLSVLRYSGQLTDPLSHALFVLAFLYLLEDRPVALAAALALGVAAKETVLLVVPAYLACHGRRGLRAWLTTAGLGAACVAAFLAARLPYGWRPGAGAEMNGAGLMVGTNLGIGEPIAYGAAPLWENYLHPLLFLGGFVPVLIWRWQAIDPCLRALCLVVVPLVLLSNVAFGWLYESRNYLPLVPLLATAALIQSPPGRAHKVGT